MYPRVTAIIVAQKGGTRLQHTLSALAAQTRTPESVIAVDAGGSVSVTQIFTQAQPAQIVSIPERIPFGEAVGYAVRSLPEALADDEVFWLLAQDTAPEPAALEALLAALEVSPSVAIVGPKLVDDDDPTFIREFGETMTPFGASVPLVENELDQAQHDSLSDVLAVSSAGMLIRRTVWEQLGGFDSALPVVDDGLDLCVRARLAGYRVSLVAAARVAVRGSGLAGPNLSKRWSVRRRHEGQRRRAQLHRRMVYAAGWSLFFHWLSLVPLAILRSIGRLLRKEPGSIGGELSAAFHVAFSPGSVSRGRRRRARAQTAGWSAIAPLRMPFADVRRTRALKREIALVALNGERQEFNFFTTGGAWTVVAALVMSVILFFPLLGSTALTGGGFLPLSDTVSQLWTQVGYGWRDTNLGFVGAADPFAAVLAILGTVTFWQPTLALVVLTVLALPLAALGAWLAAARLTARGAIRAFAALGYALAPTFLVALTQGRVPAILAHLLLPWLFFAGLAARRSWTTSATTALLAAATLACAPILAVPLAIVWVVSVVVARQRIARLLFIPIPSLVLFIPLALQQFSRGTFLSILADPGVQQPSHPIPAWQLALGFPDGLLGGWHTLAMDAGLPSVVSNSLVAILVAPVGILAILAVILRGTTRALVALFIALVAFVAAVAAMHLQVSSNGSIPVPVWPGTALSLYWLALLGAAVIGFSALKRSATSPAWAAIVMLAVVIVPFPIALYTGSSTVVGTQQISTMPAIVTARTATDPSTGTLVLTPQNGTHLQAVVVRGTGQTLNTQSTLASTSRSLSAHQQQLATLAGNLVSRSGFDASPALTQFGIDFVLLAGPTSDDPLQIRARTALDANALFTPIGTTGAGQLWIRTQTATATSASPMAPPPQSRWWPLVGLLQGVVFAITLLMALPTRRSADRVTELHAMRMTLRGTSIVPAYDLNTAYQTPVMPDDERYVAHVDVSDDVVPSWDPEPIEDAIGNGGDRDHELPPVTQTDQEDTTQHEEISREHTAIVGDDRGE